MSNVEFSYAPQVNTALKRNLIRAVERATGAPYLERLYVANRYAPRQSESFWTAAIRHLQLEVQFDHETLFKAPRSGPLVVVANHPYGVLDGLTISYLVEKIRDDFLILASEVLTRVPEVQPFILPVDMSGRPTARETNVATRRQALAHLKRGGALIIFPAGLISTSPDRWGRKRAIDPPWGTLTAQLIRRSQADVLPIFFSGQNSRIFQIVSHISRSLRLSLIFREVRARIGSGFPVAVGDVIPHAELATVGDNKAMIRELRRRTYALAGRLMDAARADPDGRDGLG